MKYWRGYLALFGIVLYICYTMLPIKPKAADYVSYNQGLLIAHAGGAIKEGVYTNSLQALDKAVENGFSYIEVDFLAAKNGDLILLRSWDEQYLQFFSSFPRLPRFLRFSKVERPKSGPDFESMSMRTGLTQLSLDSLILWLRDNPNVYIITDVKDDNLAGLTQIRDKAGDLSGRFIPQIYSFGEYEAVKELGFEDIILTSYRLTNSLEELSEFTNSHRLFALTIPKYWVKDEVINRLAKSDMPILTHTINSPVKASALMEMGVAGLYTDYLYPERPSLTIIE